jgi:all-trans-8'-apo-beta-carotenal 15,15'-oxygenase
MRFFLLALVALPGVLAFTLSKGFGRSTALTSTATPTDTTASTASTATPGMAYNQKAWEAGYTSCLKEVCENIGSDLPKDLKGTYYRNGMAKFEAGQEKIMHPFDGDGMVTAVTFNNGNALFRNRFVRTKVYKGERKMKRILERGAFGTAKKGGFLANILNLSVRDVANTNAVYWGGRLLAMYESSLPHNLEPDTLRTRE